SSKGAGVTVAIIDTGLADPVSIGLGGRVVDPRDVINNSSAVSDSNGHGTGLATAIAGQGAQNVWGVAPDARVMPVVVTDSHGEASGTAVAAGVRWATRNRADVINVSLAAIGPDSELATAIQMALQQGAVVVAAAGDRGTQGWLFPASLPGVVGVEAEGRSG